MRLAVFFIKRGFHFSTRCVIIAENGVTRVLTVVPDYYAAFRCIGGGCRHNCCIGWEIDIDETALTRYRSLEEPWRSRMEQCVDTTEAPHFRLGQDERCPFLNNDHLCEIQRAFGEDYLCDICREHPRFHNELPDRIESGVGLCCEAAAELVLGKRETTVLVGAAPSEDELLTLRDTLFALLQDRTRSVPERCDAVLAQCRTAMPQVTPPEWAQVLLSLERLDPAWGALLQRLQAEWKQADVVGFDRAMAERQTEYEQWLVYLIYRHFANATDPRDAAARACFAVLGYTVLHALGAVLWTANGEFSFEQQCELAQSFSAELEYSDENLYILWEMMEGAYYGGCGNR